MSCSTDPTVEAYPAVPGDTKCGMRTKLSRRLGRSRRVAQWPKAYRFRSSKIRFPTKLAALHFGHDAEKQRPECDRMARRHPYTPIRINTSTKGIHYI